MDGSRAWQTVVVATDKLLDRVRKLLALAESPNVHEAAAAASKAQEIITRHKLEGLLEARREAEEKLSDGRDEPLEIARKIRKWKLVLASGLAEANGCMAYTVSAGRREQHLCVAGHPDDQDAVAALWDWLVKRLEWLSATEGAGHDRDWHESFRIGAADTIVDRLKDVQRAQTIAVAEERDETETVAPNAGALVQLDAALDARATAVAQYADEQLGLKKGRAITVRLDALDAGRVAGRDIDLPEPPTGRS